MSRYYVDGRDAVDQLPLEVGHRVRLAPDRRRWWIVQAVSEHFAVCVQQAPFEPKGTLQYTVLDWRNGVRGPCDRIGQGYGDGTYSRSDCEEMLADFEFVWDEDPAYLAARAAGETSWAPSRDGLSVSQRNWVDLEVLDHQAIGSIVRAGGAS